MQFAVYFGLVIEARCGIADVLAGGGRIEWRSRALVGFLNHPTLGEKKSSRFKLCMSN
jgi:hypothetical protein